MNKIVFTFVVITSIYFGGTAIGLKYFLPEIVFKKIPDVDSNETSRTVVSFENSQALVRQYGSHLKPKCIVFFPGQHGGILRYESEIFQQVTDRGITVYSVSYPGFEGAEGNSTFNNIKTTTLAAVKYINENTSCKVSGAVYVGRSLGASVALIAAEKFKPKAILLDSVSPSLSRAIRVRFQSSVFTKFLNILPVESLISQDVAISKSLGKLEDLPIVVFQGEKDTITPISEVKLILANYANISLYSVPNGEHVNTHVLAGLQYFDALARLTGHIDSNNRINSDQL